MHSAHSSRGRHQRAKSEGEERLFNDIVMDKEEDWHKFSQHIEGRKRLRRRRALAGRWAAVVMCVACSRERGEEEVEESQGEKRLRRDRQRQRNSESGESYVHSFTM